jgi:hypothetical protein
MVVSRCSHHHLVSLREHFKELFAEEGAEQTLAQFLGQQNVKAMATFVDMAFTLVGYKDMP